MSFLVVLTDDQRHDAMWMMDAVDERLAAEGVTFTRAYVNTPLCCPSRASLLAGGFRAAETGVLANGQPNGGAGRFEDSLALPVRFQEAGYATGLAGKYLNEFDDLTPHAPAGWSSFHVPFPESDWSRFTVVEGGDGQATEREHDGYLTHYIHNRAAAFLEGVGEDEPFLLWVMHFAPHYPGVPADEHAGAFDDEVLRGPAYDEDDVSDKPSCVRDSAQFDDEGAARWDRRYQDAMASLLSVDESVDALLDLLESRGRLEDTAILFASDNGYLWGEHRQYNKGVAYEESVRVPLIVRAPGGLAGGADDRLVSVSTDLPATLYDLAGIDAETGGESLAPLVRGEQTGAWRESLVLEAWNLGACPDYAGLVTSDWKYVEHVTGEHELYDLSADPYELTSLHEDPDHAERMAEMAAELAPQKGLAAVSQRATFVTGEAGSAPLAAWGGDPPYTWGLVEGELPEGLSLSADGSIAGTPAEAALVHVKLRLSDAGAWRYNGVPRTLDRGLWVEVVDPGETARPPAARGAASARPVPGGAAIRLPLNRPLAGRVRLAPDPGMDLAVQTLQAEADPDGALVIAPDLEPGVRYWLELEGVPAQFAFTAP